MDEAGARRACRALSHDLVLALRRHRLGRDGRPPGGVRQLSCASSTRCSTDSGLATRRAVRHVVRRLRRAALCGAHGRSGSRRSCSRRRRPGVETERAAGALALAAVDVGAGVRGHARRCGSGRKCGPPSRAGRRGWDSSCVRVCARRGAPMIPSLMAERIRLARQLDFARGLRAHHGANARAHRRGTARPRGPGREHAAVLHADSRRRVGRPRTAPVISAP